MLPTVEIKKDASREEAISTYRAYLSAALSELGRACNQAEYRNLGEILSLLRTDKTSEAIQLLENQRNSLLLRLPTGF